MGMRGCISIEEGPPVALGWTPPAWLGEIGREFWQRNYAECAGRGRITASDRDAFDDMAGCFERLKDCEAVVRREGVALEDGRRHPAAVQAQLERRALMAYMDLFGLTPKARARLKSSTAESGESPKKATVRELLKAG